MKKILSLFALLLATPRCFGQSQSVQQSGPVTAGHATSWTTNGIVQDAGTANVGAVTELGITKNGGQPFCISDTKVRTAQYNQLCLGIDSAGSANIYVTGYGGATNTLTIWIDGTPYTFPQTIPPPPIAATPLRNISSGTTDTVTSNDANGTVVWNSSTAMGKTETLPQCTNTINGFTVAIKDYAGTAGTYPITVTSVSALDQQVAYIMAFNFQSTTFQCDGAVTAWVVK